MNYLDRLARFGEGAECPPTAGHLTMPATGDIPPPSVIPGYRVISTDLAIATSISVVIPPMNEATAVRLEMAVIGAAEIDGDWT